MGLGEIVPAIFLVAVFILVLPSFINSNLKKKVFFKNFGIWCIIISTVVLILFFI